MKNFVKQVQNNISSRFYRQVVVSRSGCYTLISYTLVVFFFYSLFFAPLSVNAMSGSFGGGSGTVSDPLIIEDEADLNAVRSGLGLHYKLKNDIVLTNAFQPVGVGWDPIGNGTIGGFTGSFDGNGFSISGLWIESTSNLVGLFGYARDASFKNLSIVLHNNGIKGNNDVGGLVGFLHARDNDCQIINCCVIGKIEGNDFVGGIVGWIYSNGGVSTRLLELYNCYSFCEITGHTYIGGLIGLQSTESAVSTSSIKNCYASGTISASGNEIGGLVGRQYSEGICSIINCYAAVDVSGDSRVGGFVGILDANNGECIVTNSFSVGHVMNMNYHCNGFIGTKLSEPGSTTSSFTVEYNYRYQFATVNSVIIPSGGENKHDGLHGLSITAIEFMTNGTYLGWDFDPTTGPWYWDDNERYPQLGFGPEAYPFPFYAITYDPDGGVLPSGLLDSYDPTNNASLLTYNLPEPTRVRYRFDGWFDSSSTLKRDIVIADIGHKFLVAKWTRVIFDITVDPLAGGTVTPNVTSSAAGASIQLDVVPDADYAFEEMKVYETGNPSNVIATWNVSSTTPYSFIMPSFDVSAVATFDYLPKYLVDEAIALIEKYIFNYQQMYFGTRDEILDQLVSDINKLIASTGIQITKSDISITSFTQAVVGDSKSPAGENGRFTFTVKITKGIYSRSTTSIPGTIMAITYNPLNYGITVIPSVNGTIKADRVTSPAFETITLTITESTNFILDSVWVIRTIPYFISRPLTLSGTGNVRTFIMPPYDVTVTATFRVKLEDLSVGNETALPTNALKAWAENESIHVTGLTAGQIWRVFSLSGTVVYQSIADDSGEAVVALLAKGIYIIQSGGRSIKIIKN
jgi:hypothetical protein